MAAPAGWQIRSVTAGVCKARHLPLGDSRKTTKMEGQQHLASRRVPGAWLDLDLHALVRRTRLRGLMLGSRGHDYLAFVELAGLQHVSPGREAASSCVSGTGE